MARDIQIDENGDFVINPATHDLQLVSGIDELAQRIRATLIIRYGEMQNLDPEQGSDYSHFIGKNFKPTLASDDMSASIQDHVQEVESVDSIDFTQLPQRKLKVDFKCTAKPTETGQSRQVKGGYEIGT